MRLPVNHSHMHPDGTTNIQEVITYCASRLRASLLKISDDTRTQRKWWDACFMQEMVSVIPQSISTFD